MEERAGVRSRIDHQTSKHDDVRETWKIFVDNNPENSPDKRNVNLPLAMNSQQTKVFELLQGFSMDRERFHEWYQGALEVLVSNSPDKIAQDGSGGRGLNFLPQLAFCRHESDSNRPPARASLGRFPRRNFQLEQRQKHSQPNLRYAILVSNGTPNENREAALADARRTLKSAADFTRGGGAPAPDHDADYKTRRTRVAKEQRRLIQWARENGKLAFSRRFPEFTRGGEHGVFFQKKSRRYLKITLPDRQMGYGIALGSLTRGATPSEYLDRLDLQNQIFNDDIRLERVRPNNGEPIIVISQPAIEGGTPTQIALDELMTGKVMRNWLTGLTTMRKWVC
jgi:hypothetical protein